MTSLLTPFRIYISFMKRMFLFLESGFRPMNIWLVIILTFIHTSTLLSQTYLIEIQEKWTNSQFYLQEIAEAFPDSLYGYRPTDEEMTFGEQLIHIGNNMINLSKNQLGFTKESPPAAPLPDDHPSAIRHFIRQASQYAGNAIALESEESLDINTKFFAGPKTHRQIINLMNDHLTHHRGQLIVYLRLNGITPGKYVGW